MNILSLVFSILIILSFGFYACMEKGVALRRLDATFIGQSNANRKILSKYENEIFNKIRSPKKIKTKKGDTKKPKTAKGKRPNQEISRLNPECARINLWPLIQEGREEHQLLYEQVAILLRTFYKAPLFGFFSEKPGLEYRFIDSWLPTLKALKPDEPVILEKIALKDASLQMFYYKMLRGSKEQYPSLLDLVKVSPSSDERVCLFHATPQLLSVFFGNAAEAVYEELHKDHILVTEEMIEETCRKHRFALFDKNIFALLELGRPKHKNSLEKTILEEDAETHISLRKKVYLQKS